MSNTKKTTKRTIKSPAITKPKHSVIRDAGIDLQRTANLTIVAESALRDLAANLGAGCNHAQLNDVGVNIAPHRDRVIRLHSQLKTTSDRLMKMLNNADAKIALLMDRENKKAQWAANKAEREAGKATRKANRKATLQAKLDKLTKQMEDL